MQPPACCCRAWVSRRSLPLRASRSAPKRSPRARACCEAGEQVEGDADAGNLGDVVGEQVAIGRDGPGDDALEPGEQAIFGGGADVVGGEDDDAVETEVECGARQVGGFCPTGGAGAGQEAEIGMGLADLCCSAVDGDALCRGEGRPFSGGAQDEGAVCAALGQKSQQTGQRFQVGSIVWGEGSYSGGVNTGERMHEYLLGDGMNDVYFIIGRGHAYENVPLTGSRRHLSVETC